GYGREPAGQTEGGSTHGPDRRTGVVRLGRSTSMTGSGDRQTLLILGASGDLAGRLLLPGLGGLLASGIAGSLQLVGSAREAWDDGRWRTRVADSVAAVCDTSRYLRADASEEDDLRRLLDGLRPPLVVYFALPPRISVAACRAL